MRFHKHDEAGPPCRHMEPLLHQTADGSAGWFTRLYALAHAARCARCGPFLHNLEISLAKLRKARVREAPSDDTMARLEARLAEARREAES